MSRDKEVESDEVYRGEVPVREQRGVGWRWMKYRRGASEGAEGSGVEMDEIEERGK